jgi:hypothetical protein
MYVNGFLVGPGYAASLGDPVFGWLKPAFRNGLKCISDPQVGRCWASVRDEDNVRHARTSADSRSD